MLPQSPQGCGIDACLEYLLLVHRIDGTLSGADDVQLWRNPRADVVLCHLYVVHIRRRDAPHSSAAPRHKQFGDSPSRTRVHTLYLLPYYHGARIGGVLTRRRLPTDLPFLTSHHQVSSGAPSFAGGPLPTALRRLAAASDGRTLQQQQPGACLFSTNSSSAVASESPSSDEEEEGREALSSSDKVEGSSAASSASPSASGYTVVKHPPTPGWEFPPVPAGCEPTFAVIRLGNTQHKVCL